MTAIAAEFSEAVSTRMRMYLFLADIFGREIDAFTFGALKNAVFPHSGPKDIKRAYALMESFLKLPSFEALKTLKKDYSKNIGTESGNRMPVESGYRFTNETEKNRAVVAPVLEIMENDYYESSGTALPPDHLAVQLGFMAFLCDNICEKTEKGDTADAANLIELQRAYLSERVGAWAPVFCEDFLCKAETDFYKGAALLTGAYLAADEKMVSGLARTLRDCYLKS